MEYNRWQYRVEKHENEGDCPRCGGAFVKDITPTCVNCGAEYPSAIPLDAAYSPYDGHSTKKGIWKYSDQERNDIVASAHAMRELGSSWDDIAEALMVDRKLLTSMVRYEL